MSDSFKIPVTYKGKELLFDAEFLKYAYSYKIQVDVNGTIVLFERDYENNFRAMMPYEEIGKKENIDVELLKVIGNALEEILK